MIDGNSQIHDSSTQSAVVQVQCTLWAYMKTYVTILTISGQTLQGSFPGGLGVPLSGENFVNSPTRHLSPFFEKFEKIKYIFVSNLTTFKLKSTLKAVFYA